MKLALDIWYESWKRVDSQNGQKHGQNPKGDEPGRAFKKLYQHGGRNLNEVVVEVITRGEK